MDALDILYLVVGLAGVAYLVMYVYSLAVMWWRKRKTGRV